jgi:acid stress chaperone HdeB
METFRAAVLSAALLSTMTAALADDAKIEMSKLSCAQYAGYNKDNMGLITMWLEGYYTEEDDDAVIDFGKMAGDMARLLIYCGGHPETDIITASDEVMNQ